VDCFVQGRATSLSRDSKPFPSGVEHTIVAKLVKLVDGRFKGSRIIYAETLIETVD
jgi:hypothetical protein